MERKTFQSKRDKALLVCLQRPGMSRELTEAQLNELAFLLDTLGFETGPKMRVRLTAPQKKFLVGSGKAGEIIRRAGEEECSIIVFDDDLSPSQQRNLEELSGLCVIDRREVILDIFSKRAKTKEARLQVELARIEYSLPRLKRAWTHLSRQRGGTAASRGEGEKQLEMDRRRLAQRLTRLKEDLAEVQTSRETKRKQRKSIPVPSGSIVGYTNAGKSSLLHALTGAEILIENKLFASLDPTTRRIGLKNGTDVLLTDTVGFIRKLPHDLVDAFHSTLEETLFSDFLIQLIDASSPDFRHHLETTNRVLSEIGAESSPRILVFNKIDLIQEPQELSLLKIAYPDAIFLSIKTGEGIEDLLEAISSTVTRDFFSVEYLFPSSRYDLAALVYRTGKVDSEQHHNGHIIIHAQVPVKTKELLSAYAT